MLERGVVRAAVKLLCSEVGLEGVNRSISQSVSEDATTRGQLRRAYTRARRATNDGSARARSSESSPRIRRPSDDVQTNHITRHATDASASPPGPDTSVPQGCPLPSKGRRPGDIGGTRTARERSSSTTPTSRERWCPDAHGRTTPDSAHRTRDGLMIDAAVCITHPSTNHSSLTHLSPR